MVWAEQPQGHLGAFCAPLELAQCPSWAWSETDLEEVPWNYYVNQHSTWCQRWHAKAADFKDSISQSNSPFSDSRNGAKNKLNHTVFNDNYVFLLKIGRFLELLLSMDPAKNDTFLRSGRKIIILTQIIMLIWVSGYINIYIYIVINH